MSPGPDKVLCVDDEPSVLEGLRLHLRRNYDVHLATSGAQGLETIEQKGPFAVVISDMQMPAMNGAAFLSRVRQQAPDTVRVLLTGQADMNAAAMAVNDGQIFRFLSKPCAPERLRAAVAAAADQHRLISAERVLLEQTLHGVVKTLTDMLTLTSPLAFGRASRIRQRARGLAESLKLQNLWQVEVAAMLSQLGCVTLPDEIVRKQISGEALTAQESTVVDRLPAVTDALLANIPRLEPIREILDRTTVPFEELVPDNQDAEVARAASILRVACDFEALEAAGQTAQVGLDTMRGREGVYDHRVLDALAKIRGASVARVVREIPLEALAVGMVFAQDVRSTKGLLLVTRGFEVTPSFLARARNFRRGYVVEPLRVYEGSSSG